MLPVIDSSAFIAPGAVVLGDVQIGADSSVWYYTVIRGDTERIRIGEGTNLQDFSMVHADPGVPCLIGSRVTVGHRAILHGCTVEDECLIGMGAILLNGVKIGSGSVVGAGSLVREGMDVPPGIAGGRLAGAGAAARRRARTVPHRADLAALHRTGQSTSLGRVSRPAPQHADGWRVMGRA